MAISVAGGIKPGKIIEIEHRLYQQLIVGKSRPTPVLDEIHTGLEDDADKLEIERQAIHARLAKQVQAKEVNKAISTQLIASVNNSIEHRLSSPDSVLKSSELDEKQIWLLEQLYSKSPDLSRIRPLVIGLPWLARDLINIVNSPSFRHRRPKSSDIQVTDIKLVLNYIGMENLQALIPYFCLRNLMPNEQPQLLWMTRKLWRYSLVSVIAAQALVSLHNKDRAFIYSCALLNQLGNVCVISNCASMFDQTRGSWLREASNSRDKELYDAVMATALPATEIFDKVLHYGRELNWQLLSLLKFDDSRLTQTLKALDQTLSYSELIEDAALIERASCYAKVLLLEESGQLQMQEKRMMFDYYELTAPELLRLKAQNYRKLDLC